MKIAIYQIGVERDSARVAFRDLNYITSAYNGRIPTGLYDCVFSGEVAAKTLEDVAAEYPLVPRLPVVRPLRRHSPSARRP